MYLKLRVIFTVLSAICLAAAIPLGFAFDLVGVLSAGLGALLFFGLMLLCKQSQEKGEQADKPDEPSFFQPKSDDEPQE